MYRLRERRRLRETLIPEEHQARFFDGSEPKRVMIDLGRSKARPFPVPFVAIG